VAQCLASMHEALSLIPAPKKKKKKTQNSWIVPVKDFNHFVNEGILEVEKFIISCTVTQCSIQTFLVRIILVFLRQDLAMLSMLGSSDPIT
jgi:hypothetical protein